MKTTLCMIPATVCAADNDVEALRRQLEGGGLELNEDGTVSVKGSGSAQRPGAPEKKKLGDVPGGVLGADTVSPEVADLISEFCSEEEGPAPADHAKKSKKLGDVPSGVLGTNAE